MKNPISEFFANPVNVMMAFFLMLFVIKEAFDLFKWYKGRVDEYRAKENKRDDFEKRVDTLENGMKEVNDSIKELTKKIDEYEVMRKDYSVAQSRATLFQLYEAFKDKDDLTLSEYETFNNLAECYLADGGNGVFRHKIIPEIQEKKVTDN